MDRSRVSSSGGSSGRPRGFYGLLLIAATTTALTNASWNATLHPGGSVEVGYYFYFSGGLAAGDTRKHLGVAVSDSPTGPFRDALGRPLVAAGAYSGQMIDPAVFTDDGQPYLYWGRGTPTRCR